MGCNNYTFHGFFFFMTYARNFLHFTVSITSFRCNTNLRTSIEEHVCTGVKCDTWNKEFKRKSSFKALMKAHHSEATFNCSSCKNWFIRALREAWTVKSYTTSRDLTVVQLSGINWQEQTLQFNTSHQCENQITGSFLELTPGWMDYNSLGEAEIWIIYRHKSWLTLY